MKIAAPALQRDLENAISLEEAVSLTLACEQTLEGFSFEGGALMGMRFPSAEVKSCVLRGCRLTGIQMPKV